MDSFKSFEEVLYRVNDQSFDEIALRLFQFQASHNEVYREYISHLRIDPKRVSRVSDIPYLPVSFFRTHEVKTGNWSPEVIFTSSGTTGQATSRHLVHDLGFYQRHSERCFNHFYGDVKSWRILALLPSYFERGGSSLIAMLDYFIRQQDQKISGFYHRNPAELLGKLSQIRGKGYKTIVWGVAYALMDLAAQQPDLSGCTVVETGGMKGRRKEVTREELHQSLTAAFGVPGIHSEYGMTEMMSQAYSHGLGVFQTPPWLKLVLRDPEDPLSVDLGRLSGGVNIIDLGNIHSCAFIETQDLGRRGQNGRFEILGRLDNADIRGCNLLVE